MGAGEAGKPQNEGLYHLLIGPLILAIHPTNTKNQKPKKERVFTVLNKIVVHELVVKALSVG